MKYLCLFVILLSLLNAKAEVLEKECLKRNGKIVKNYICPKSKIILPIKMCLFKNINNTQQFFDGCSGFSGKYESLFINACIMHDLCYHHEPISNNKSRSDCDYEMLSQMKSICTHSREDFNCVKNAELIYKAVRIVGAIAYNCSNSFAKY